MIPIYERSTAEVLSKSIAEEVAYWIPQDTLVATSTTDGAANEVAAGMASTVYFSVDVLGCKHVGEDNHLHCCAHNMQLALGDVLDGTRSSPPLSTRIHRNIIQKLHDLVVLVRGHSQIAQRFAELSNLKRNCAGEGSRKFEELVLNGGELS